MPRYLLLLIIMLTAGFSLSAQEISYMQADRNAEKADSYDPAELARLLTAGLPTETEKARAIFRWITLNIKYRSFSPLAWHSQPRRRFNGNLPEDTGALKPLDERVAIRVLNERRSLCEGYARLFKDLCDHAGLEATLITGYARDKMRKNDPKFRSNHCWNAVKTEGSWHLLDVTWGSGFINQANGEFVESYDDSYFFSSPEIFAQSHFPDDLRWTLEPNPLTPAEFVWSPFRPKSFVKYPITGYMPETGIIDAYLGDTIKLVVITSLLDNKRKISPDSLWEKDNRPAGSFSVFVEPAVQTKSNSLYYSFPVTSTSVQWLHLMYNNDAVLRYRLHVRPRKDQQAYIQ